MQEAYKRKLVNFPLVFFPFNCSLSSELLPVSLLVIRHKHKSVGFKNKNQKHRTLTDPSSDCSYPPVWGWRDPEKTPHGSAESRNKLGVSPGMIRKLKRESRSEDSR